jgi:hypothetical protein
MESERQGMERESERYASMISNVVEYFEGYGTLAVILSQATSRTRINRLN